VAHVSLVVVAFHMKNLSAIGRYLESACAKEPWCVFYFRKPRRLLYFWTTGGNYTEEFSGTGSIEI
jgi:hypothetical protein